VVCEGACHGLGEMGGLQVPIESDGGDNVARVHPAISEDLHAVDKLCVGEASAV
jgi:hypothetical protein